MSDARGRDVPELDWQTEAKLHENYFRRIRLLALSHSGARATADDIAQETLRRVIEALRAGRLREPEALPGFVLQVARNVCLRWMRSARREASALSRAYAENERDSGATQPSPLDDLVTEERRARVRRALERLGDEDRGLLGQAFDDDVKTSELAGRLGLTTSAIRVRKHRALRRLAELLKGDNP